MSVGDQGQAPAVLSPGIPLLLEFVDWVCELLDHFEIHIRHRHLFLPPTTVVKCNVCRKLRKRKVDSECGVFDRKEVWVSVLVTRMAY
jgi:hypothetical protein